MFRQDGHFHTALVGHKPPRESHWSHLIEMAVSEAWRRGSNVFLGADGVSYRYEEGGGELNNGGEAWEWATNLCVTRVSKGWSPWRWRMSSWHMMEGVERKRREEKKSCEWTCMIASNKCTWRINISSHIIVKLFHIVSVDICEWISLKFRFIEACLHSCTHICSPQLY